MMLAAVLFVTCTAMALPIDKYTIKRDQLPEEAQKMISDNFPKAKIAMIKIDKHWLKKPDYKVRFTNGTTIEFNNRGKWKEVDCNGQRVPDALIMKTISRYISKNYPDSYVTKIEKSGKGYSLELSDNIELKFDLLGTFKKAEMDD